MCWIKYFYKSKKLSFKKLKLDVRSFYFKRKRWAFIVFDKSTIPYLKTTFRLVSFAVQHDLNIYFLKQFSLKNFAL